MRRFPTTLAAVLLTVAAIHPTAAQMTRTSSAEHRSDGGGGIGYEHLHNASIVRAEVYEPERQLLLLVDADELWPEVEDETGPVPPSGSRPWSGTPAHSRGPYGPCRRRRTRGACSPPDTCG